MTLTLADQLKKRIKEKKLSMREVEKRADLGLNAVRNIIKGVVKQPGAQTLKTIANVLECSVDDLLETNESAFSSQTLEKDSGLSLPLEDFDLFLRASVVVAQIAKEKGYKISLGQALNLMRGIYTFSSKKKNNIIDMDFVEWLFEGVINS